MEDNKKLIEVKDLKVSFFTPVGEVKAVDGISYSLGYNEVMGIVGESGSGKSVEAFSIMGLLAGSGRVKEGSEILLEGKNILEYNKAQMEDYARYLVLNGFLCVKTEDYDQGTSYFYENKITGMLMDIFVMEGDSYVVVEPYTNAEMT